MSDKLLEIREAGRVAKRAITTRRVEWQNSDVPATEQQLSELREEFAILVRQADNYARESREKERAAAVARAHADALGNQATALEEFVVSVMRSVARYS